MRPRSNTYKEVNSRPHSSVSMLYNDTWTGNGTNESVMESMARTERQFHTLERETSRGHGRHPGQLETMRLEFDDSIDSLDVEEQELLHCLTPAPSQFTDEADNKGMKNQLSRIIPSRNADDNYVVHQKVYVGQMLS